MSRSIDARRTNGNLSVIDSNGQTVFEEAGQGRPAFSVVEAKVFWYPLLAWWRFRTRMKSETKACSVEETAEGLLARSSDGGPLLRIEECEENGILSGKVEIPEGVTGDWLKWEIRARGEERFLGFGERFNAVDQTGNRLYVWAEEGAYGLGERFGKIFDGKPWNPFPNGPTTAYKPLPFFISTEGYGLLLETPARVEYDICSSHPEILKITIWDRSFSWKLFYGPEPSKIIELLTEHTGRASVPAPWVFAPWADAILGSRRVREVANKIRGNRIPTTSIWTEDWQGGFFIPPFRKRKAFYTIMPVRYKVDRRLYPDAEDVADELHSKGFRWLSYFFPYILRGSREYREAKEKGYLLKNRRNGISHVLMLWHPYGQIDLTNEEAKKWYMGFLEENLKIGFDGWMADFGEYVPPSSVASDGSSGLLHHNVFPLLWQKMHRELLDELRPDGDYVFFSRSASIGSQKYAPVFWSGDSNTDFEKYDGLPSNIPAVLSAGISGIPFWAADIAGYVVATRARDKELFYRWTEFAAFLPVMRTHHGTKPLACWQFDSDRETLKFFGKYARLHTALFPYFYTLAHEASRNGLPVIRHLLLHYPKDRVALGIKDEFLVGDRILVAPVVERGAAGRMVYLPQGEWIDYWDGKHEEGGKQLFVDSPLGHIPVFLKCGSILPTLDLPVDTLAPVKEGSGITGYDEALKTIRLTFYGQGEDTLKLWDGTEARMWMAGGTPKSLLQNARASISRGKLLESTPEDALQPERDADCRISVTGDSMELTLVSEEGKNVCGASYSSPFPRDRVTLEWR
ncbi:MAG: glycoside hydrolase family 31 protein [Actinomycetota bacterium]|nr:glycoside hydrolase family 31 protein [Actinomycetota bacterium]